MIVNVMLDVVVGIELLVLILVFVDAVEVV